MAGTAHTVRQGLAFRVPGEHWFWTLSRIGVRVIIGAEVLALALGAIVVGGAYGAWRSVLPIVPQPKDIESYQPKTATVIYDSDGNVIAKVFDEDRDPVSLDEVPKLLREATIAIEDKRFYQHMGFDPRRLVRVTELELRGGGQTQGASTITMQLAREIYLTKKRSFARKIQELALSVEIERMYAKDEILEMYLNQVCYGDNVYGVKAAARHFYHKDLRDLTLPECALLAGLPNNPSGLSPYSHPRESKERRDLILSEMANQGRISATDAERAKAESLGVKPRGVRGLLSFSHPYFTEYAVQELIARYGEEKVHGGGLRVYTTLNSAVQDKAQELVREGVANNRGSGVRQAACVVMEPTTGRILAIVGGTGWSREDQFNRALLAERQPGSAMKPFVWATALEYGFSPSSVVSGEPCSFHIGGGLYWSPRAGGSGGSYTLASALAASVNIVSARLTMSVGPEAVVATAKKLGIRTSIRPFPSIALGSEGVTVLDMTTAFCCFANGGMRVQPTCIAKICDSNGVVVEDGQPKLTRVLSQRIAYEMNEMMQGVVRGGTGTAAQGLPAPTAGKTGTTDSSKDAWFVGFTPKLACGVWVGNDENDPMGGVFGGNVPCPIWRRVMGMAVEVTGKSGGQFPGPGHELPLRDKPRVKIAGGSPTGNKETPKPQTAGRSRALRDLFN